MKTRPDYSWGACFALTILLSLCVSGALLAAPSMAPVVVTRPAMQPVVEEVPLTGTVTSPRVASLSPEVAGLIDTVGVDAGDRVVAGDTLVTLDASLARLAVEAATAATELAQEELADARRRLADAERLSKSRGIPKTEVEARRSEVRADAATLKLRRVEQQREQERLRRFTLKAPFDGVISHKYSESGEWVTPGDDVLELVADRELRIDLQVPQRYFARVDRDTRVTLRIDGPTEQPVVAQVGAVVPVSDPSARTFLVRVYPERTDLSLTPGMSASAMLALATERQGLVISRDALLRHPDGRTTVWVVDADGDDATVSERQIRTGLAFDGGVVVHSGLESGQRVVVDGNEALQQGQRVVIRGER